jgi:hypothetical protein
MKIKFKIRTRLSISKHFNTKTQWFCSTLVTTWETSTMITFEIKGINLNLEYEWKQVAKTVEQLRYPFKVNNLNMVQFYLKFMFDNINKFQFKFVFSCHILIGDNIFKDVQFYWFLFLLQNLIEISWCNSCLKLTK